MKQSLFPIHKTGWFYLLVLLWVGFYWYVNLGVLNGLNQFNREILYQILPMTNHNKSVVRLRSSSSSAELSSADFSNVVHVLERYHSTPVVLLGNLSDAFKRQLHDYLAQNKRQAKVIIATEQVASGRQVKVVSHKYNILGNSFNRLHLLQQQPVQWMTANDVIYSPLFNVTEEGLSFVWRYQDNVYLTLIGEAIRQTQTENMTQIKAEWELELQVSSVNWALGVSGKVYSAGALPLSLSLKDFASMTAQPKLIVIDDSVHPLSDQIVRTAERVLAQQHLHQGLLAMTAQWLLLLFGLVIIWLCRRFKIHYQLGCLLGYFTGLLVCQYIAFTQMQWLAVLPSMITVLASWIVIVAYQREIKTLELLSETHNRLLGEALPLFYQSQKLEKFHLFLEQTNPDQTLIDKAFDVALQAEADKHSAVAKKIYSWIQNSGVKHKDSQSRLEAFEQMVVAESLEQTLVIEPGQSNPGLLSIPNYQIESFGRYQVEGVLGKGAMGIVFQGVDPKINRHVAIKTLQLSEDAGGEQQSEIKTRFFREAETAGNLSHANIVTIYDVGEEGELGYIAMDLLTGAPLSEFIKSEHLLPMPLVYQLMIQITDALDYAHRQNVVHRDIKPANIIYDDEIHRVTLTDFGIACVADKSKTRTGMIMGSPYYMSPEQVLGKRVDGRSDIFSLGVTLYQLLSGHLPFQGESIASVAYHITNSKPSALKNYNAKLPASATRISNKAMNKDINKRFQTAQEFKQALVNALKRDFKKAPLN